MSKDQNDDVGVDFDTLKRDINKLKADASKMTQKLSQFSKDKAEYFKDNIIESGKGTVRGLEKKFKDKPILTVGSAFGIGLLLGMVIKRCCSRRE